MTDTNQPRGVSPARILIVGPESDASESLALLLRLLGHEVRMAPDVPRAIETARRDGPSCMLVDVPIPGADGRDAAMRLRGASSGPVLLIAVTDAYLEEDGPGELPAGFDMHFVRPVQRDGLEALLDALTAAPRASGADGGPRIGDGPSRATGTIRREVEVVDPFGLHMRPADRFAAAARRFASDVRVRLNSRTADGKSILDLTILGASCGDRITVEASGPDADEAVGVLVALLSMVPSEAH